MTIPQNASRPVVALKVSPPAAMPSTGGGGCDWTGRLVRFEHEIPSFFRRGCKVARSPTPVRSSSIPPEGAWLTGRTQSGRLAKSADPFEDRSEELSGHGDFRKLERHVLGVPGGLGTDLDELLLQRGQRPLPHALWKCQPAEEVPEVVRQGEELQTSVVCPEGLAGEPSPPDGILALLDPLLRRSTTVVEPDHFPCLPRKIRDDEAHAWKQLVGVPLDLGDHTTFSIP